MVFIEPIAHIEAIKIIGMQESYIIIKDYLRPKVLLSLRLFGFQWSEQSALC